MKTRQKRFLPEMTYDPVSANPLHGNPLKTRADVEKGLRDLFNPLLP